MREGRTAGNRVQRPAGKPGSPGNQAPESGALLLEGSPANFREWLSLGMGGFQELPGQLGEALTRYLLLQVFGGLKVGLVVRADVWDLTLVPFPDAALQLRVVLLQLPHLLQIVGQSVVQDLHGRLLVAIEAALAEPAPAAGEARGVAPRGQIGARQAAPKAGEACPEGGHGPHSANQTGGPAGAHGMDGRHPREAAGGATEAPGRPGGEGRGADLGGHDASEEGGSLGRSSGCGLSRPPCSAYIHSPWMGWWRVPGL